MNIRPLVDEDAAIVVALISAEEERFYGRPGRLTGAVQLYERVGMYVDSCGVAFEKANE